jgi:ribonucleoside-diphosphate reductase alpha chain
MKAVKDNKQWELKDPNDDTVRDTISARKLWEKVLETRFRTGEPYVNFIDTANKYLPQELKDKGLKIHGSNLCNEIHLPTNEDRTAVCCLSSLNLELYDEWKDTTIVQDLIRFLDNVLQFFIDNAPDEISRARYSATQERSLGLGAMGLHSLFQRRRISFESQEAKELNEEVFSLIQERAIEETLVLGKEKGEAPDMKGSGRRNAHLLAIAPNANSSMIVSCSPSIEPHKANAYTHRTRAGSHLIKNIYLRDELEKIHMNTPEVWTSIITNGGSVQHLDFLDDEVKEVFKTAIEIDQKVIVQLGGDRQKHICQGQSLNLFFPAGASKKYVHEVHFEAWKTECKGLYYLRTETSHRAENVSEKVKLEKLKDYKQEEDECTACQG